MEEKQVKGTGTLKISAREQRVNQQQERDDGIDLVELFFALLARWKMILLVTLAGAIIAGAYTQIMIKPTYKAKSTIYVLANKDTVVNMSDLQIGTALANDYVKIFDMWEVHEMVRQELGLDYTYAHMKGMLSVSNYTGTRMLDISVTSTKKDEAIAMANAYAKVVREYIADKMVTDPPSIMSVAKTASFVGPNRTRNIILGMLAGLVIATGIAVVNFLMNDTIRTADDIQRHFGLINLAVIPVETGDNATGKSNGKKQGKIKSGKGKPARK